MIALASLNRRSENVGIEAVVITELKLRNIQRQIFLADLMIAADDAALEDAPEALNRIRVNCADNVLTVAVIDGAMLKSVVGKIAIGTIFVGSDQANFIADHFVYEGFGGLPSDVIAFDELNHPDWPGETIAMLETLRRLELRRLPWEPTMSYAVVQ